MVAFPQTAPVPPSKDTGANYQQHPQSTGPYKFQSFQLNKQYTLVPNPMWNPSWDPQVKQLASKVVVNLNVNANDIDNRLVAGDIQMDQAGSGVQAAARAPILFLVLAEGELGDEPGRRVQVVLLHQHQGAAAEQRALPDGGRVRGEQKPTCRPPTAARRRRRYRLHGDAAPPSWATPSSTSTTPLSMPGGEPAAARQQLKLCGHPSGFSTNIAYRSDRPREVASSQALQASLNSVGIKPR